LQSTVVEADDAVGNEDDDDGDEVMVEKDVECGRTDDKVMVEKDVECSRSGGDLVGSCWTVVWVVGGTCAD
jgi:hypothetical protein